jgi:hypothetical protein
MAAASERHRRQGHGSRGRFARNSTTITPGCRRRARLDHAVDYLEEVGLAKIAVDGQAFGSSARSASARDPARRQRDVSRQAASERRR